MRRNVVIEKDNHPAVSGIYDHYNDSGYSLREIEQDLIYRSACSYPDLQIGRGGSHVWVADKEGNRLLIIR